MKSTDVDVIALAIEVLIETSLAGDRIVVYPPGSKKVIWPVDALADLRRRVLASRRGLEALL